MYAPVPIPATIALVTPVPPTAGAAFTDVMEYTKPFSMAVGQVPVLVTFPFIVADEAVITVAAEVLTACATVAVPVPVKLLVGELLPLVVLLTVMVAVLEPADEGVNVTL